MGSYSDDYSQRMSSSVMNLAYQEAEEYPELVEEIESTIMQRNKSRVQNTMRHFELLSRNNKNMDKPLYDYDDDQKYCAKYNQQSNYNYYPGYYEGTPDSEHFMQQQQRPPQCDDYRYSRSRRCNEGSQYGADPSLSDSHLKYNKYRGGRTLSNTRWEMDPRTGEWIKVFEPCYYDGNQFQQQYEEDHQRFHPTKMRVSNGQGRRRSGSPKHLTRVDHNGCHCRHCSQNRNS